MKSISQLIEAIERVGFECEGGPLVNFMDWIELKKRLRLR
jgi:hypothetical protein